MCDWADVRDELLPVTETGEQALEQAVLDYIRGHGRTTTDPAEVLATAWRVYAYLFRDDLLPVAGLEAIGPAELRMLREAATLMALNKVETDGHISNISPPWFFGEAVLSCSTWTRRPGGSSTSCTTAGGSTSPAGSSP